MSNEVVLSWPSYTIKNRRSSLDEPTDPVEASDRHPVVPRGIEEPTECLGFSCQMPYTVCDVCRLNKDNIQNPVSISPKVATNPDVCSCRSEARQELSQSAPTSRGFRGASILWLSSRWGQ